MLTVFANNWAEPAIPLYSVCIGPAVGVFKSAGIIPIREFTDDLDEAGVECLIDELKPSAILLGTSLDSWTERLVCAQAYKRKIFCLAVVDWWSNFGRRFSTPGTNNLSYVPNAIAVMDEDARQGCIADGLPEERLFIAGNPFWDYLLKISPEHRYTTRARVRREIGLSEDALLTLVISSNIRKLDLNLGYDESDFWASIVPLPERTIKGIPIQWAVKPHPGEIKQDLESMLSGYKVYPLYIEGFSAFEAIAASDFVLGMCSSVLFETALQGKTVVSLQPGLNIGRLDFLRIFDHLGVPKIISASGARKVVEQLVNGKVAPPDLNRMPEPIGNGYACQVLSEILLGGIRGDGRLYE